MNLSIIRMDDFKTRFSISLIIYILFIILKTLFGTYNSYIIILPPSVIFVLYIFIIDNINLITKKSTYVFMGVFIYFLIIIYLYPQNIMNDLVQVLIKASFEELLFRLCMIGILKKYLNFTSMKRMMVVLIINSLFFTIIHTQYTLLEDYATIYLQTISYGLTYLSLGIFASIISHTIWNLYLPNIILQLPIFIVTVGNIYYLINRVRVLEKRGRVVHVR